MTTPRTRALVSFAATIAATLALDACVPGRSIPAADPPAPTDGRSITIHFENDGHDHVHVYLVGTQRQWLLGRVEPWARATLRVPKGALASSPGFVQLAVLTGERLTLEGARHPRARFTIAQPASAVVSRRWTFSHGQLSSLPLKGTRAGVGLR
jgi:hypothetical protein